jgi:Holliday junction DNA helicase RuvA
MIRSLRGTLASLSPDGIVIDIGGVGMLVHVSVGTQLGLPPVGNAVQLETHLVVREDALDLFGFLDATERELFVALTGVSGVGPRTALAICGLGGAHEVIGFIASGDIASLQRAPGIGKRTAERIVLDLRDRVGGASTTPIPGNLGPIAVSADQEVRAALLGLGFRDDEISHALIGVHTDAPADERVRHALTQLRSR